jgi:hypothetical protein
LNLSEDQENMLSCLRQLDSGDLLQEVISALFTLYETNSLQDPSTKDRLNTLLSILLQFTDQLTFRILKFFSDFKATLDPFVDISSPKQLHTIFRLFDAQPFLRTLWDTSPLYLIDADKLGQMDGLVCWYLRQMVHNDVSQAVEMTDARLETVRMVDSLRINKKKEQRRKLEAAEQVGELMLYRPSVEDGESNENGLVSTPYLSKKIEEA